METASTPANPRLFAQHSPRISSVRGWPLVLYFHHVSTTVHHYTALTPRQFALGLDMVLEHFTTPR